MKKNYSQIVMFGFSLFSFFFLMACGEESGEQETSKATESTPTKLQTTSVEISIKIPDFSNAR